MRPLKVLAVDDSEVALAFAQESLEAAGFRVETTNNPLLVASRLMADRPDVLLLDVDMPGLLGTEVAEILRKFGCSEHTRIVLHSARDPQELTRLAGECGAAGSIPKGVSADELSSALRSHLELSALVVSVDLSRATGIRQELSALGLTVQSGKALGIDRTLRDLRPDLLILEAAAFEGLGVHVLRRVRARGLLEGVTVMSYGAIEGAEYNFPAEGFDAAALRDAVTGRSPAQTRG